MTIISVDKGMASQSCGAEGPNEAAGSLGRLLLRCFVPDLLATAVVLDRVEEESGKSGSRELKAQRPFRGLYGDPKTVNSVRGPLGLESRILALLWQR